MSLEELLRNHPNGRFCLKTHGVSPDREVQIMIHPDGEDGTTLDFIVNGNILYPTSEPSFIAPYDGVADQ